MRFNKHLNLQGEHAFLSPSQYHWIHYTPDRLIERWTAAQASSYGIAQHGRAEASELDRLKKEFENKLNEIKE